MEVSPMVFSSSSEILIVIASIDVRQMNQLGCELTDALICGPMQHLERPVEVPHTCSNRCRSLIVSFRTELHSLAWQALLDVSKRNGDRRHEGILQ